jgi:hypothetical protein
MGRVKTIITLLLLISVLITLLKTSLYFQNKSDLKLFQAFNRASLNGKLFSVSTEQKGTAIRVFGVQQKLIFYPRTDEKLNNGHFFTTFAEIGDSVKKARYNDTLFLIKDKVKYIYLFRKHP